MAVRLHIKAFAESVGWPLAAFVLDYLGFRGGFVAFPARPTLSGFVVLGAADLTLWAVVVLLIFGEAAFLRR